MSKNINLTKKFSSVLKVTNEELTKRFNRVWGKSWVEEGYELEFSNGEGVLQYLFTNELGVDAGSLELKLNPNEIMDEFNFLNFVPEGSKLMEVDKLSILKEERGEGILDEILTTIVMAAEEHQVDYCIALIEPVFYRALRAFYKLPVQKAGKMFFYKGDDVVPMVIDAKKMIVIKEQFEWFKGQDLFVA